MTNETQKPRTDAETLAKATEFSPTGYRRRRKGHKIPKMAFGHRCDCVLEGVDEISDKGPLGVLTIEEEKPLK